MLSHSNCRPQRRNMRIETQLDAQTARALDQWRKDRRPQLSRSDGVRRILEEHLSGEHLEPQEPQSPLTESRPAVDLLASLYVLERVSGFGPIKFRELHEAHVDPEEAVRSPNSLPFGGRTGEKLRAAIRDLSAADMSWARSHAHEQLGRAAESGAAILVHGDPRYPARVYESNNPLPVLYVRGDPAVWASGESVAVVGSRSTREPYAQSARAFASAAACKGKAIVSGFAIGADSIGHIAARDANGHTICVMPCGVDKVFPPENRDLWDDLLSYSGATFVSEFGFGQRASSLRLRKRNKLIVAFSQGVLVAQSASDGGAMNAYRFAREQRKPVATFRSDGQKDTAGNTLIGQDPKTGGILFECATDRTQYDTWLDGLSY